LHNKCLQNLNKVEGLNFNNASMKKKLKSLGPINFGKSNDLLTGYELSKEDFVLQN